MWAHASRSSPSFRTASAPIVLLVALVGCATFRPNPVEEPTFLARAETKEDGNVRVTVAVPSRKEAKRYFGVNVNGHGIQPVWLRIENLGDDSYVLMPILMDPNYFSPGEAAWKSHFFLGGKANHQMDIFFDTEHVPVSVAPGATVEGFVYTNLDEGVKYVEVDVRGERSRSRFDFQIEVPGIELDYQRVDWEKFATDTDFREVDEPELRAYLEQLPCCVLGGDRTTPGDPMNIVVIARGTQVGAPFLRRGWDPTETIRMRTRFGTAISSVLRRTYRTSPVSALFVFDRPQDFALQKARASVDERNHLRLWATRLLYEGKIVWVGQISRDIGVRMSRRTIVTHKIDPNVDEARFYLTQDLTLSGRLERFGYVKGVGPAGMHEPRHTYTLDPYYTDGLRAVYFFSDEYTPYIHVDWLEWEDPSDWQDPGDWTPAEAPSPATAD